MSSSLDAFLRSWPFDPWLDCSLLLSALVYFRGWRILCRRDGFRWSVARPVAFFAGLGCIFLALASPIEPWSSLLLQVHMLQHLLLMMLAPPLLWLGWPLFPILRGLPAPVRIYWAGPLLRSRTCRALASWLTHPVRALILFVATTWLWHIPAAYDLALRSNGVHYLQHLCFLGSGLIFWYPVVRPYPSRPRWSTWLLAPYLILADLENTVLSALLTFSSKVLYSHYERVPHLGKLTALDDQAAAGVLMWVPGSLAFLGPLFVIGVRLLYPSRARASKIEDYGGILPQIGSNTNPKRERGRLLPPGVMPPYSTAGVQEQLGRDVTWWNRHNQGTSPGKAALTDVNPIAGRRIALPLIAKAGPIRRQTMATNGLDLLRIPLLGQFLKWRHSRIAMQLPLLLLSTALIFDGLRGPQVGSMNLAGVLPWIHWRGIVILGLLAVGNVFCMACPFVLPRTLARRLLPRGYQWPRWLRNKWLAIGLLIVFLWAYEAFSLWDSPWLTAWIAITYFVLAFAVDTLFQGGTFCKYVCPIGQFNFVQSLVSPFEVRVRDPQVCTRCHTKDCIRGRDGIPGCELKLAQPRKAGNLDCTTCLDCVHACPHDNLAIAASPPAQQLWSDPQRSGIGRFSRRPDLAALIIILVFGAFANAAGMTAPVQELIGRAGEFLGWHSTLMNTTAYFVLALIAVPLALTGLAALASRGLSKSTASLWVLATRYSYALIPLGFGMWLAHYSFHFLTSFETVVPVTQRFLGSLGWPPLGTPRWNAACCRPVQSWLPKLEMLFLDFGLLLSLYTGYQITLLQSIGLKHAIKSFLPWAFLIGLLFAAGIWLIFQPMQMRGTM